MNIEKIILPEPTKKGGNPLMETLNLRESCKNFLINDISLQKLSDLLWAMFGINRPDIQKCTAPSAKNWQATELYVIKKEAVYLYNKIEHSLILLLKGDFRQISGLQDYPKTAPVNIILVSNLEKIEKINELDKKITASMDAGFISQNAYLYCASEDLGCVARLMLDKELISSTLNLPIYKWPAIAITVGFKNINI